MAASSPSLGSSSASVDDPHNGQGALPLITEGGPVIYTARVLRPSRNRWRGRGTATHVDGEVLWEVAHEERTASLGTDPHPPPCITVAFPSLESFHPRRSSRLVDNTKLTQREASHFITTAIAAEEDGSEEEEEKGLEEGVEDATSIGGLPL